jgi:ribonuclease HII
MKSISEIKKELNILKITEIPNALLPFEDDERIGVKELIRIFTKKYNDYLKEMDRLESLNEYENVFYKKGFKTVAGVDEVGRGPLAGAIVACCVIFPKNTKIIGINDSKKLSESRRKEIYSQILDIAVDIKIGIVENQVIDEVNILNANYMAMSKAIEGLTIKPDIVLVDGYAIPNKFISVKQESIINGDAKSISIAAASIVAKVTRDEMMKEYHIIYPEYNFASNKGYGTSEHINALSNYGACPIHRNSFIRKFI